MIVVEYRSKFRQRVKALLGGPAAFAQFFRVHPFRPSMLAYCRLAYRLRMCPLTAAREWVDYKCIMHLGNDSRNNEAALVARREQQQKKLFDD